MQYGKDEFTRSHSVPQQPCPYNGAEEVYCEYYDTAGNYHWIGTMTGEHILKVQT